MNLLIKLFTLVALVKNIHSIEYAIENGKFYDVMKHQPVVFTCTYNGTIDIREYPLPYTRNDIIKDSVLADDRFTYMNTSVNGRLVHKITLKNATIDLHYAAYTCYKNNRYCCVTRLLIPHRQETPMCITNYYTEAQNESTRFECVSEYAYPPVNLEITTPLDTNTSMSEDYIKNQSYTRNDTHVTRIVEILGNVENIYMFSCEAYQNFSSGELDKKICYFEPPIPTSTSITTILYDIINLDESNSGIPIYGSVILVLVCLLIH